MKKDKIDFITNDKELEKIKKFVEENKDSANEIADEVAKVMQFNDAQELIDKVVNDSKSTSPLLQERAAVIGGEFAAKLSGQLFDQIIFTNYANENLLTWYNKFYNRSVSYGARVGFIDNVATGCTVYDITKYIPTEFTNSLIDTFEASFLKADNSDSDTTYRFKKNKSVSVDNWLPYFISGKVNEVVAAILADLAKGYSFFLTKKFQDLIASIADGSNQTTIANAGENGKSLKLKKFDGNGVNTYEALIELNNYINDLTNDFNKTTLATDSRSLFSPSLDDLVIFIPKQLKSIVDNGILARIPNSNAVTFNRLLSGDNVITVTKKLKEMQKTAANQNDRGNEIAIDIEANYYLPEDTIVVIEKRAIHHFMYIKTGSSNFYGENLVHEHVYHAWGFLVTLPFAKGFVYKNSNLLNYKF